MGAAGRKVSVFRRLMRGSSCVGVAAAAVGRGGSGQPSRTSSPVGISTSHPTADYSLPLPATPIYLLARCTQTARRDRLLAVRPQGTKDGCGDTSVPCEKGSYAQTDTIIVVCVGSSSMHLSNDQHKSSNCDRRTFPRSLHSYLLRIGNRTFTLSVTRRSLLPIAYSVSLRIV